MGGDCTKVTGHATCRRLEKPLSWLESQGWRYVEKYTPTDGCPGRTCILLGQSTVLPHTEARRARIVTLMQQGEEGKSRLEEHERKKRSKRDEKNEAPERDVTADDAAGAPADKAVQASEERRDEGILPYPDNPEERSSLKRAPAEPSSSSTPAGSKAKASPVKPQKRSGELRIAAGPKLKVQPPENLKYQLKI